MKPVPAPAKYNYSWPQVMAFRLERHHFLDTKPAPLVDICRDVCGIQAQVMGAAHLSLWTRGRQLSRTAVQAALWQRRELVKTSLMRQTIHLAPSTHLSTYIEALRPSRMKALMRGLAAFGVSRAQLDEMNATIVDMMAGDPVPQRVLTERIRPRMGKRLRAWSEVFWSVVRPAMVEGLLCYGPDQGREVTVVRVDRWLPKQKQIAEQEAKSVLLRDYLRAYGPATVRDFCKWSGIGMKEAAEVWQSSAETMTAISVEGMPAFILHEDLKSLAEASLSEPVVRLLPSFDVYLLAHADKAHLVKMKYYKRVYRNQGWLTPVVLLDGRIIGVWSFREDGKKKSVSIELFEKVSVQVRRRINQEIESLLQFA